MNFSFSVNEILKDEITCVDSSLEVCRRGGESVNRDGFRQLQSRLFEIVDKMGEASGKAQGLHGPITSGRKLTSSDHRLYIMKDSSGNSGKGCVVGILKVGTKKLFVYDKTKRQHEVQPLCVLDFYVHESRQRMGCGRRLFDFMLMREHVPVQLLAIDRPSSKLLHFMAKHYNLQNTIPQVYNFVIFEGFFSNRSGSNQSPDSQWLDKDIVKNVQINRPSSNTPGLLQGHLGAGRMMYSRHGAVSARRPASNTSCHLRKPHSTSDSSCCNQINRQDSTHTFRNSSTPVTQQYLEAPSNQSSAQILSTTPEYLYKPSSLQTYGNNDTVGFPEMPNMNSSSGNIPEPRSQVQLPNQQQIQRPLSVLSVGASHQLPIGSYPSDSRESNPPLLQRDGPPSVYKDMFNMHQKYQQRNGHLSIPAGTTAISVPNATSPQSSQITSDGQGKMPSYSQLSSNNSWTVMGVLRDQRVNKLIPPGHNNNHRLW